MLISEIYRSDQGEGILTGTPSVFVRTSGCNLRCDFCDTPFASWEPEGTQRSVDDIMAQVHSNKSTTDDGSKHVVVTGGEPMLPAEIVDLTNALHEDQWHITIETAGTIYRTVDCDLMSISPKMSNSTPPVERAGQWTEKHDRARYRPKIIQQLIEEHDYQIKFVVQTRGDMDEIFDFLDNVPSIKKEKVLLMPEGVSTAVLESKASWLEKICEDNGFRFCQRQHIFWYGNRRGT